MSVVTARPRGNELAPDMLSPTGARINVNNQNLILGLESLTVKQQVGAAVGAKVFAGKLRRRTEETRRLSMIDDHEDGCMTQDPSTEVNLQDLSLGRENMPGVAASEGVPQQPTMEGNPIAEEPQPDSQL